MSNTLILNSSNVIGTGNNTFLYKFKNGNFNIPNNSTMCVGNIQIPYAFPNVSSSYNNQSFQITWRVGATVSTYTLTLPQGFYTINDINNYIQQYCIANGFYLIDSNGNNVYYLNLSYNQTFYAIQLLCFLVPTSLPSGYTQPANFAGYPSVATSQGFNVLSSNNFGTLIGFNSGNYGNSNVNVSKLSDFTPIGSNINSIVVRCNLVNNNVSNITDILDSFPIGTTSYGSNINYVPSFEKRVQLNQGSYSQMIITLTDQNNNLINSLDPNVCITLLIKTN